MSWRIALFALAACGATPVTVGTPAYITHPTPEGRIAIQQAVSVALHGTTVNVAEDALTGDGVLVIEPNGPLQPNGPMSDGGRGRAVPERFHLVKIGESCVLVQDRTGNRTVLNGAVCSPR